MDKKQNSALLPGLREGLLGDIDTEKKRLLVCLAAVFGFGLIAHGWGFLHMTVSQDSLSEFYFGLAWKFHMGRYGAPAVRYGMGEMMVLPWLTGLTGLAFLAGAVYLISRMFRLDRVWENAVLGGICAANAVMTTLIATYIHDFAGDMLALLLAVTAACLWAGMEEGFSWKKTLLGAGCLYVCFTVYQAYLAVTATLMAVYAIRELLLGKKAGKTFALLLRALPMCLLAVAAYGVSVVVMSNGAGYGLGGNGGNAMKNMGSNLSDLAATVGQAYVQVMRDLFLRHWTSVKAVFGPTDTLICLINTVLAVRGAGALLVLFRREKLRWPEILLILALILALPLFMSCVSIVSKVFHNLVRYAAQLFYLLILVLLGLERKGEGRKVRRQQLIAAGLIGFVILSNVQVANTAYVKKDLEERATLATMTRVLDRLEEYEDYTFGQSQVLFAGVISSHQVPLRVGEVDCLLGMASSSQIAYNGLESNYFKVYMGYPINPCPPEKKAAILASDQFAALGSFPARDCIATIDGVVVVKLSDSDTDY